VDEGRRKRIAMNEATYRTINEAMRAEASDSAITFLCECGRLGCNQLIRLTRAEYETVRGNSRRFAIVPGHDIPDTEDVVERHERYAVIEKHAGVDDIVQGHRPAPATRALTRPTGASRSGRPTALPLITNPGALRPERDLARCAGTRPCRRPSTSHATPRTNRPSDASP
jgi:hypothetical protein